MKPAGINPHSRIQRRSMDLGYTSFCDCADLGAEGNHCRRRWFDRPDTCDCQEV